MRARIESIELVGTSRRFEFNRGLSIISGPISTGKTTLIRMCRAMFGSGIERFPEEAMRTITALAGRLELGDQHFSVLRPFVPTTTAKVEIAGDGAAWRLPALELDATAEMTYGQWLLDHLGLPRLEVPTAPTRLSSDPTPVSINDYFLYCWLSQDEIDASVFGHRDPFKDIKRRYVFQILYGLYDVQTAQLLERLRGIQSRLNALNSITQSFSALLEGTPWENRMVLQSELESTLKLISDLETEMAQVARRVAEAGETQDLRAEVLALESSAAELRERVSREREAAQQLRNLLAQLRTQSSRLTRAIVAHERLVDFEFVLCPRCGTPLPDSRGDSTHCLLCLQVPKSELSSADLAHEQDRIGAQIEETQQLIVTRETASATLDRRLTEVEALRKKLGGELTLRQQAFVAGAASEIAARASRRAELTSTVSRLNDYLRLYQKADAAQGEIQELEVERRSLMAKLEAAKSRGTESEARIRHLEKRFEELVEAFHIPRFTNSPSATISRQTFLPILDGRRFDELSSQGLLVLVNVAHALAHHLTAIDLGLPLPGILFIDGLTSNLGHEDEDFERVRGVYEYLIRLSEEKGRDLQLIVADHDVPDYARDYSIRFTEADRLIPTALLQSH